MLNHPSVLAIHMLQQPRFLLLLHPHLAHHPADSRSIETKELSNLGLCLLTRACPRNCLLLETLKSMEPPTSDPLRDYRWRISISKTDWAKLAAQLAAAVDYPNFKARVHERTDQANKGRPYLRIWGTMQDVQLAENRDGNHG
jgi:hypothetical protein